jgi:hypothetical protein
MTIVKMQYSSMNNSNMDSRANYNRRRNYQYEKPAWELERERVEKERQEAQNRNMQQTEENFPVLGRTVTKPLAWTGRKFNELATEWKEIEDKEKAIKEQEDAPVVDRDDDFVLPVFRPSRFYVEEEETPAPVEEITNADEENDGWVTVDRSLKKMMRTSRKEARINDRLRRLDDGEELDDEAEDDTENNQDETCWNGDTAPAGKEYTV